MADYRRVYQQGGCYFFTVVTHQRAPLFSNPDNIHHLKTALHKVKQNRPFKIDAIVIMPDHIHTLWQLPDGDCDFSSRWREIKKYVSRQITQTPYPVKSTRVWQSRFWEHLIRDDNDWRRHMDYIHYNPVKHGYVNDPVLWPWSSLPRCIENGLYIHNWGVSDTPKSITGMDME